MKFISMITNLLNIYNVSDYLLDKNPSRMKSVITG